MLRPRLEVHVDLSTSATRINSFSVPLPATNSLIHLLPHSLIHSFIHSLIDSQCAPGKTRATRSQTSSRRCRTKMSRHAEKPGGGPTRIPVHTPCCADANTRQAINEEASERFKSRAQYRHIHTHTYIHLHTLEILRSTCRTSETT